MARGVFAAALIVPFSSIATAQHGGSSGGMGGMGSGIGGFIWWPLVWSVVLLSLVALVAYGVLVHRRSPVDERNQADAALSTLRSRYARGELSEEEFEKRRRRLEE
ncbi:SHOCT domain-containing protein (plasmid) [Halobacterium sp. NMX12-1]|uniref:SHOCT domain-containing protein n=1 Tax=Halobacterium sp. NMX12-1 TaxID=3166650 RepID=A0AAU8C862_9EURY